VSLAWVVRDAAETYIHNQFTVAAEGAVVLVTSKEIIDRIFKEPGIKFELTEFQNLGKPVHEILAIYPKTATTGKDAGKTKYYLKSFIPFQL